jgi:hypothetical protein
MHRAGAQRPGFIEGRHHLLEVVGHHHAADRFGGVGGPPAHQIGFQTVLLQDVPDRLGFTAQVGDRPHPAAAGIGLAEPMDPMLMGPLAGGDRGPQHRREHRIEGGKVAHHSRSGQPLEVRHLARIQQRPDDLPVGSIPAEQKHFVGHGFSAQRGASNVAKRTALRQDASLAGGGTGPPGSGCRFDSLAQATRPGSTGGQAHQTDRAGNRL